MEKLDKVIAGLEHMDECLELRTCYCPFCDKYFEVSVNDKQGSCPGCGRHVVLRGVEVDK